MWLVLVTRRPCLATEHSIELLSRRLREVACRRQCGLQWRKLGRVCARGRGRRSIVALRRGRRRVRVLPAGRLARRLLRGVRAVLVAGDLLLLLLLLWGRQIRRCRRGVHRGVPRSGPGSRVFGLRRQVLGVPVAGGGRAGVLLLVVGVGVLHWHVTVQVAVVGVGHGVVARRVRATAGGCREAQVGGATGDRGRAVSVVLGRGAGSGRVEGCWQRWRRCGGRGGRQVAVWGLRGGSGARVAAAGYCCMPGAREGGGLVRREVTRRRGRPGRVSVHVASGGRQQRRRRRRRRRRRQAREEAHYYCCWRSGTPRTMRCERAREGNSSSSNSNDSRRRMNGPVTFVGQRATGHSAPSQQWGVGHPGGWR